VRTTVLYGEFELAIDEKNRLLVPAEVRRALDPERDGEAFFITVGVNRRPWLYPERRYEAFVSQMESELTPGEDRLAFDQMFFSMASKVDWDKQGRILVPDKYRVRTNLSREVTLVGVRDHLELWNRPDWAARMDELESQRAEIAARQRQAQPGIAKVAAAPVEAAPTT
jgi:MraZ protein